MEDDRPAFALTRRRILAGALALPFGRHVGAANSELLANADGMDLVALPGKKGLIRRSFRPPDLETPTEDLKHALTSNESGKQWPDAALGDDMGRYAWREFRFPIDTSRSGRIELLVRAKSRSGAEQPQTLTPNPSGYHHNIVQRLQMEIV